MSGSQVPLWVPIVVGLLGLAGVIGAQLVAGWREDRRWRRETAREELRWQRERERERENRSYEGRAQAYAEVVGAIEAFDWVLYRAREIADGQLDEHLEAELREVAARARDSLGTINVHAPESVRRMLRESMLRRSTVAIGLLNTPRHPDEQRLWDEGLREYRLLRAAMRRDLGLDAEDDATVHAEYADILGPPPRD
ncbi:hypothetical protein [Amycolatopsis suaedae]|uniref:Uncharacterized protein n=1 Tax=Amycolatopsis suaedae TaxID=2510978 RepID=A0A4Q7JCY8_9PSEU|nr:hypothetical protein [Amycolatopsis suaedae]RZQ65771.1 hypothetical protein EWH70_01405 [Amycolatopsis suaedae]